MIKRLLFVTMGLIAAGAAARAEPLDHLLTKDVGLHKVPHEGTSHILVIPSRVGSDSFSASQLDSMHRFYATEGGPGTFREYWRVVSRGRYDPIPTVVAPVLYPDSCPLEGRTVDDCALSISDLDLLTNGAIGRAVADILTRVRDEQSVDLALFDVNGAEGGPDGFFDGVIMHSDIYDGIGFPLAELNNAATVQSAPGGGGRALTLGIVAMAPPELHEFAHTLGFVDLYGGPPVNDLLDLDGTTLSAFSRQQIGWGEVQMIREPTRIELPPVLDGGPILRVGDGVRYLLIENRGGPHHAELETTPPGINIYSIDENQLPYGPLGFLDVARQDLYLPNRGPNFLNVNLPVACSLVGTSGDNACVLSQEGARRALVHASGDDFGLTLTVDRIDDDGTIAVRIEPPNGCGMAGRAPGSAMGGACMALCLALLVARRRARSTRR